MISLNVPQASVLMTVYNEDPVCLERAIASILAQTFEDFELILVDDGSIKPETIKSLDMLASCDSRIRLMRGSNRGPAGASNIGLSIARAPLVFRHDSDDWSDPERFARQVAFLNTHPEVVVVGSACQLYQENGLPFVCCQFPVDAETIRTAFQVCNPFAHGAICFRRESVLGIGGYREQLWLAPDYDLLWRLCERWQGANLTELLYHRLIKATSVTARGAHDRQRIVKTIRLLAESRAQGSELNFDIALAQASENDWSLAEALTSKADELMRAGCFAAAAKAYLHAVLICGLKPSILAKLGRLVIYTLIPAMRYRLFSEKGPRKMLPPVHPAKNGSSRVLVESNIGYII